MDFLFPELEGHIAVGDPLGQAFGDGGLAHARLANQTGVVLLTPVQNLDHPFNLLFTADHRVELPVGGLLGEGDAVVLQIFPLCVLGVLPFFFLTGFLLALCGAFAAGEEAVQEGEGGCLTLFFLLVALLAAGQVLNVFHAVHGLHHFAAEGLQIFIRDPHALHHVVHLGQTQILGAFQA